MSSIVEEFIKTLKLSMINGSNVYLRGFSIFLLKKRAQEKVRNIKKGTSVKIPAHSIPTFKPAEEFESDVKAKVRV